MICIKEIYQWYRSLPNLTKGMTPIQKIEYVNNNHDIFNRSFIGEKLTESPAIIYNISTDGFLGTATYRKYFNNIISKENEREVILGIQYQIIFNKDLFYETIKSMYNDTMVLLEGKIMDFEKRIYVNEYYPDGDSYHIKLDLTKIIVTKEKKLSIHILEES